MTMTSTPTPTPDIDITLNGRRPAMVNGRTVAYLVACFLAGRSDLIRHHVYGVPR